MVLQPNPTVNYSNLWITKAFLHWRHCLAPHDQFFPLSACGRSGFMHVTVSMEDLHYKYKNMQMCNNSKHDKIFYSVEISLQNKQDKSACKNLQRLVVYVNDPTLCATPKPTFAHFLTSAVRSVCRLFACQLVSTVLQNCIMSQANIILLPGLIYRVSSKQQVVSRHSLQWRFVGRGICIQ